MVIYEELARHLKYVVEVKVQDSVGHRRHQELHRDEIPF